MALCLINVLVRLNFKIKVFICFFQIPPPKPPPPEMHFIPNPANTEFICLLGLEECVGKILHENKENTVQPIPFTCSQCATDFTPTWKWDKGARGSSRPFNFQNLNLTWILYCRALRYKLFFIKALTKRLRKLTIITKRF
jgi:hypothetical protein